MRPIQLLALLWLIAVSPLQSAEPRRFRGNTLTDWEVQLSDPSPAMRARAATALGLGRFGKPAVPLLRRAVHDADASVVTAAMDAVGMMGSDAVDAIPVLLQHLHSDTSEHWEPALAALKRIGPASIPALLSLPRLRYVQEVGNSRTIDISVTGIEGPVIPPLIDALCAPHKAIRLRAMRELEDFGPTAQAAVPALTRLLQDDDKRTRSAAANALLAIAPSPRIVALVEERIRQDGVSTSDLNHLLRAGPEGVTVILRLFRSRESLWKVGVLGFVNALDTVGPEVFPLLQAGLDDQDDYVRHHTLRLILSHNFDSAPFRSAILRALEDMRDEYRGLPLSMFLPLTDGKRDTVLTVRRYLRRGGETAMYLILQVQVHGPAARHLLPAIQEQCEADGSDDRRLALSALLSVAPNDPVAIRTICRALKDPESSVRLQAASLLGYLEPSVRRQLLTQHSSSARDRLAVETALVVEALQARLVDPCVKVRVQAARSLQKLGHPDRSQARFMALVLVDPLRWSSAAIDRDTRLLAGQVLGDLGPAVAEELPLLLLGLHDGDTQITEAVIGVLRTIPAAAQRALPWLRRMLLRGGDDRFAQALVALGEPAVPVLREGLQKKDEKLTRVILGSLFRNPVIARPLISDVIATLEINNDGVYYLALSLLRERSANDPRLIEMCAGLLSHADRSIRHYALSILGGMGAEARSALPAVRELLLDPLLNVRQKALETIARLGADDSHGVPDLIEMLSCAEPEMRSKAAEALAIVLKPSKNIGDTLRKAFADSNEEVRLAVCRALVQLGDYRSPIQPLERLMKQGSGATRVEAALLLWRLDRREAVVPTLCEVLHDSTGATRQQAHNALVHLRSKTTEVRAFVRPLLSSRQYGVRRYARSILEDEAVKGSRSALTAARERMP